MRDDPGKSLMDKHHAEIGIRPGGGPITTVYPRQLRLLRWFLRRLSGHGLRVFHFGKIIIGLYLDDGARKHVFIDHPRLIILAWFGSPGVSMQGGRVLKNMPSRFDKLVFWARRGSLRPIALEIDDD